MHSVSVIIPTYNVEQYLAECLDSVLGQSLKDIEIICINDGSTDRSGEILDQYKEEYPDRLIVIHQENQGVGITRNRGIEVATGEFIAFMDPDDYYPDSDVLKDLYCAAKEHEVLIAGGSFCEDHDGKIVTSFRPELQDYIFTEDRLMTYEEHQFDFGYIRFIYNRKMIVDHNIKFPPYIRFQDPPFFVKAMITAGEFYALRRFGYCYRWGHQQIDWTHNRTLHMLKGVTDNLILSREHRLAKLHRISVGRIETGGYQAFWNNIAKGDLELLEALIYTNGCIDESLIEYEPENDMQYMLKPLKDLIASATGNKQIQQLRKEIDKLNKENLSLRNENNRIRNSRAFKLGEKIAKPIRMLRTFKKRLKYKIKK